MSLSPFQKEKLEYYFNLFDTDGNGILELKDLDGFMKKVLEFTGWSKDTQTAKEVYEVHACFFSTLTEKANKKGSDHVTLERWLSMWQGLIPGCMAMSNFPIWVRLLPKCLFRIIDLKEDGRIDEKELTDFYVKFVGIKPQNVGSLAMYAVERITDVKDGRIDEKELTDFYVKFVGIKPQNVGSLATYAMEQMTDHGRYPLTLDSYMQMFANFLIGKTPYGPGRFIFGCFEHMVERTGFHLIQGPPENIRPDLEFKKLSLYVQSPSTPTTIIKKKFFRAG